MTPKISVITATYNSEKFLQKSIDSVAQQGYPNLEYIIIDGGSSDRTEEIILKNSSVITKWISEPDDGIYDAWNKGIEISTGEWIAFIGSDDFFKPGAIQSYVDYINSHCSIDCLYISSKIEIVSEHGRVMRNYGWPWNWAVFRRFNIIAHPGSFQSKKLYDKYGLYNTDYKIVGDYEILLRPKERLNALFMDKITLEMTEGGVSSHTRMFKEIRMAVIHTAGTKKFIATFDYILNVMKLKGKHFARKVGLNLYLKKPHS